MSNSRDFTDFVRRLLRIILQFPQRFDIVEKVSINLFISTSCCCTKALYSYYPSGVVVSGPLYKL
jgi:hypothetical protein